MGGARRLRAAAVGLLVGLSGPVAASADVAERPIVVIVSAAWSEVESVSLSELRDLWLGRRTRLAGERVECLDLPSGSRVRRAFGRVVLGQSERALEEYWIRQALTGGHVPPREVGSTAEVVRAVAERRGGIGYVDAEDLHASPSSAVRVLPLMVDGRALSPTSPEYPIRWRGDPKPPPAPSARDATGPGARRTPPRPRPPS